MEGQKIQVKVKTKKGEVEVPAILEADGTLNIDVSSIKDDLE